MSSAAPDEPGGDTVPDALWNRVDEVPGWLTRAQGDVLRRAVRDAGDQPVVVEIGSHQGRSTVVLATARPDAVVTAVDPFVTARLFAGPSVRTALEANLERFGVGDRVDVRPVTSREARATWSAPVDVLYVDGKHDYRTVVDDLRWARHVRPGAPVLVHDAFSSIGVTLALLGHVLPGRRLAYTGRTGSLAHFAAARPTTAQRWAMVAELPWWGRNVVVKVLLRLRLRRVAALLGHPDRYDPY